MHIRSPICNVNMIIRLTQQARSYGRDPFPSKVSHYLYRAKLIDSIRLSLRSNRPNSLPRLLNDRLLDSFVVTHALRSAPSANSALTLVDALKKIPSFSHTQNSLHALATVLAKSRRSAELKSLITDIVAGRFGNVRVSFMNLLQWHSAAGHIDSVLEVWDEYKLTGKRPCTESYNIVMALYAQMGKDSEAVKIFYRMIDEGAIPNCRTYTIIIEHLVKSGKSFAAMEVFNILPLMRIKRTLKQYSVLVESFIGIKRFGQVKTLLNEMQSDGILPSRAMCLSLHEIREEEFLKDIDEFFKESLSDERIKNLRYSIDSGDDEDEDDIASHASQHEDGFHLKPWLDPRALASALQNWGPDEVSALEAADFVWTTRLVSKILRNFNSPETAWNFFCWVAYQPGFTHDIYTVQRMMTLLARHGRTELVDRLISKIRIEGMRLPFSTIRLLIDFYGISKNADAALKVFNDDRTLCGPISKFNLMLLYSSLLRALTKCGRNSDTLDILDEMILNGIFPDTQTFSGLMHHFAHLGDIKTVQKLFSMVRQSGLEPDAYMFKVLIQGYCKSERAALAWRIFEEMKSSNLMPDSATKELLVKSLWKEGRRREAAAVEESCEEINEVLPLTLRGHIWSVSSADLTRLRNPSHPSRGVPTAINCLAALLKESLVRSSFVQAGGVKLLVPLISPPSTQQSIQVVRVVVLTFKNLLSKGILGVQMVDFQLPQVVQSLKAQAWTDEDLLEALNYLEEGLKDNLKKLSSFDKYKQEVLLGNLDWSPMRKDPIFWRENINHFEENDFQTILLLDCLMGHRRT